MLLENLKIDLVSADRNVGCVTLDFPVTPVELQALLCVVEEIFVDPDFVRCTISATCTNNTRVEPKSNSDNVLSGPEAAWQQARKNIPVA